MQTLPKSITPGRYRRILPIFALALTSGLALTACGHTSEKVEGKALAPSPASKVAADGLNLVTLTPETEVALNLGCEKVSMKDVDFAVRSTGEVQANSNLTTKVSTPVSGRIIAVMVNIGDHVKEGQTLASIRSQDIEQTEADLLQNASQVRADLKRELLQIDSDITQNRAQLGLSQSTYARVKGLFEEKIASKADFESAKTQFDKDRIDRKSVV